MDIDDRVVRADDNTYDATVSSVASGKRLKDAEVTGTVPRPDHHLRFLDDDSKLEWWLWSSAV